MLMDIQKILVVDDEVELAHAIQLHLSRTGFTISSENNITAARKQIETSAKKNTPFDLVITDISMPGGTGIELSQWIQENYPAISILLISGFGEEDLIAQNTRPLLDDFCKKPFSPKTLLTKIRTIEQVRKNHLYSEIDATMAR